MQDAGFHKDWTYNDIKILKGTPDGKKMLVDIDNHVRRVTGLDEIAINDINACYPGFYSDYICTKQSHAVPTFAPLAKPVPVATVAAVAPSNPQRKRQVQPSKHCNWEQFQVDIEKSIREQGNEESESEEPSVVINYLQQRAELEFRNLINIFQNKSVKDWNEFVSSNMKKESRGHQIQGTTYYIPWHIFDRYTVCFGVR